MIKDNCDDVIVEEYIRYDGMMHPEPKDTGVWKRLTNYFTGSDIGKKVFSGAETAVYRMLPNWSNLVNGESLESSVRAREILDQVRHMQDCMHHQCQFLGHYRRIDKDKIKTVSNYFYLKIGLLDLITCV